MPFYVSFGIGPFRYRSRYRRRKPASQPRQPRVSRAERKRREEKVSRLNARYELLRNYDTGEVTVTAMVKYSNFDYWQVTFCPAPAGMSDVLSMGSGTPGFHFLVTGQSAGNIKVRDGRVVEIQASRPIAA